ncbi:MAG: hypothetical protein M1834_002207 [Cirrosporium novae-zelandiae]|nr:MAG: hypothetical protein M1834_002207 [Cirrosporium novae-zelandiae]
MPINYLILLSRQGKVNLTAYDSQRLAKWFTTLSPKDKAKIIKDVSQLVLARRTRMCNFLEYKDTKIVYRRYASLFFIAGCSSTDNELITLEIVHRYVEQMDKYYGNVCELDIIFNFQKAYFILDELLLAGEMQESSKKNVLRCIGQQDSLEDMEFLPLREFDDVTEALNFDTADCHVRGGCDLYTTKAAGSDKKLYKDIENSLEAQYESHLRLCASLSPPAASSAAASLNLSRSSPFGPLSQISSRRTFAYLIATLNASHPDYDYSDLLRPTDFHRERSLKAVMNTFNTTVTNFRPRPSFFNLPPQWSSKSAGPPTPGSTQVWGPRMWRVIDKEMTLRECDIYRYAPEEDPYDEEEGVIWSYNYFFFNKTRKRVCYLYLHGLSIMSHSPTTPDGPLTPKKRVASQNLLSSTSAGASKRARYWLGEDAALALTDVSGDELVEDGNVNDLDGPIIISDDDDEGTEDLYMLGASETSQSPNPGWNRVRNMSEEIAESMEM